MSDFTDGETFLGYLSSFWTQVFQDTGIVRGLSYANAAQLQQLYQNFVESVSRLSIKTIPVFHKEFVYPIILQSSTFSSSLGPMKFGDGEEFGLQPAGGEFKAGAVFSYGGLEEGSGLYCATIPDNLKSFSSTIVNSLFQPSVVLVRDVDFFVNGNVIQFKNNPFQNNLIPQRQIPGSNHTFQSELVLWILDAQLDIQSVYQQFGFPFCDLKQSSEAYRSALEMIFKIYSEGPSLNILDSVVAALANAPVTKDVYETVLRIDSFGGDQLVVTDLNIYQIPNSLTLRQDVAAGSVLQAGQPLTTMTQVFDKVNQPNWWMQFPGMSVSQDFVAVNISNLGFLNQAAVVELQPLQQASNGTIGRPAQFYLAGSDKDIKTYWNAVLSKSVEKGMFLGNILYEDAGLVSDGEPDFSQTLIINPLEFLTTKVLRDGLIPIQIQLNNTDQAFPLFQNLSLLRDVCPAWLSLVIFISIQFNENIYLENQRAGGVEITEAILVPTAALLSGSSSGFDSTTKGYFENVDSQGCPLTNIPEALSVDINPEIITEILDFGNPNEYGTGIPLAVEQVSVKFENICN